MNADIYKITPQNHDSYVRDTELPMAVLYFSSSCAVCRFVIRKFIYEAQLLGKVMLFGMCQVDDADDFRLKEGIVSVPAVKIWKDGKTLNSQDGYNISEGLTPVLNKAIVRSPEYHHVYADNASTTPLCKRALDAFIRYSTADFANPATDYESGHIASGAVDAAKRDILSALGASSGRIIFTSGGTESINQAILSAAYAGRSKGKTHLVTTAIEHHSVINVFARLKNEGFEVTYVKVPGSGIVRIKDIIDAVKDNTALVSVMTANNETGTVQPVKQIGAFCHRKNILFHTDAVQAAGHIPVRFDEWNADYLSISAHKFNGPKGVGALITSPEAPVYKLIEGASQQSNLRAGTVNVPGIMAMSVALNDSVSTLDADTAYISELRDSLMAELLKMPGTRINGSTFKRLPGNISISFRNADARALLFILNAAYGIEISAGSACNTGSVNPSHVLTAMGISGRRAKSTLRITLSKSNTKDDIAYIAQAVSQAVNIIR